MRMDRLTVLVTSKTLLEQFSVFNKLMNSFILRFYLVPFQQNVTLQLFCPANKSKCENKAMCMSRNLDFEGFCLLFNFLNKYVGVKVVHSCISTSTWKFNLLGVISDLSEFASYCRRNNSKLEVEFEPELINCIHVKFSSKHFSSKSTACIWPSGKVMIFGIRQTHELTIPINLLSDLYFDYVMQKNFSCI